MCSTKAPFEATFEDTLFLEFENLTVAPIQTSLIDVALLTREELSWINAYNAYCFDKVWRCLLSFMR
jgi:C-terminal region of peptidase_M24